MSLEEGKKRYERSMINPLEFTFTDAVRLAFDEISKRKAKDPKFDTANLDLIVHKVRDEDGTENVYVQVVDRTTKEVVCECNDANPCPPLC